jgi:hypothetical protein
MFKRHLGKTPTFKTLDVKFIDLIVMTFFFQVNHLNPDTHVILDPYVCGMIQALFRVDQKRPSSIKRSTPLKTYVYIMDQ